MTDEEASARMTEIEQEVWERIERGIDHIHTLPETDRLKLVIKIRNFKDLIYTLLGTFDIIYNPDVLDVFSTEELREILLSHKIILGEARKILVKSRDVSLEIKGRQKRLIERLFRTVFDRPGHVI